jgi:hypothetical protein
MTAGSSKRRATWWRVPRGEQSLNCAPVVVGRVGGWLESRHFELRGKEAV